MDLDADTIKWIVGISITAVLAIGVFVGNHIVRRRRDRATAIQQKLRIHFNDINEKVIKHILEMSNNLTIRNKRLVFGSYAPVSDSYQFESDENYPSFRIHFPEKAKEWKELNDKAVKLNGDVVNFFQQHQGFDAQSLRYEANEYIKDLKAKFRDFALGLTHEVELIDKYDMGKRFKKYRNCPICKKF